MKVVGSGSVLWDRALLERQNLLNKVFRIFQKDGWASIFIASTYNPNICVFPWQSVDTYIQNGRTYTRWFTCRKKLPITKPRFVVDSLHCLAVIVLFNGKKNARDREERQLEVLHCQIYFRKPLWQPRSVFIFQSDNNIFQHTDGWMFSSAKRVEDDLE